MAEIKSPCVRLCRLERGACAGCGRTLEEIKIWSTMTDAQREEVMESLKERGAQRFARAPEHDRRMARGDDFAGDAWIDKKTFDVVYGAVGHDRNTSHQ